MTDAADRKRAQRERERHGRILLSVEVDEANLCVALVDAGLIRADDQGDREKLAHALSRLVELAILPVCVTRDTTEF
jgi:hypothetical protein